MSKYRNAKLRLLWQDVKKLVKKRSNYCCAKCGARNELEVDHIVPLAEGGSEFDADNLQVLCHKCHIEKHKNDGGNK